jgi:hypothetical protein
MMLKTTLSWEDVSKIIKNHLSCELPAPEGIKYSFDISEVKNREGELVGIPEEWTITIFTDKH